MIHIAAMIITIFFYGHAPESRGFILDPGVSCPAVATKLQTQLDAAPDVRSVTIKCVEYDAVQGDKT